MVKTFDILLDLEKDLYSPSSLLFTVSRNDFNTVQLNFVVTQDGTPVDLTNKTVELAVKKPSGLTVYQACEITSAIEGKAKIDLSQQAYIEYGIYTAEVYIRDVNNLAVTSPFWYQSRTPIFNETTEEAIQSSNDWSALQEVLFAYDLRPQIVEGYPTITPLYVGQIALDTLNGIAYIATALTSDSWIIFGGGGSDTLFGNGAPIDAPARVGQLYIDELNKSAYISTGVLVENWEAIDNEQFVKQAVTWGEILEKPTAFTPEIHTHDYVDIQNKPLTFPPEEHGHEIIEVIGLQDALDLKADDSDLTTKANSVDVYTKLETYNKTEVNGLVAGAEVNVEDNLISNSIDSALSANQGRILDETKADINHNHDSSYAPINHNHDATYLAKTGGEITDKLIINNKGDGKEQLRFDIERAWTFKQLGTLGNTILALQADTDKKDFAIVSPLGATALNVRVDNLGGNIDSPEIRENGQKLSEKYSPIIHNHAIGDITGLQDALDLKVDKEIAPIKLNVTTLTNAVQLNWEVGTYSSFAIWRSDVKGNIGEKLAGGILTNSYLDSTALGGTTYYYTLQVDENISVKTISDQVEATPYTVTVYDSKRVEFAGYAGWTIYGSAEATADFGNEFTVQGGDRLKIDTGEKLRFYLPAGQVGSANTGGIIKAKIAGKSNYTFEYGIRFDGGFAWSKGGKVPGFSGGAGYTGGAPAWNGDGFSVRLMWREGGRIIPYVYHYNQKDEFGDTFGETLGYFTDTKEHIVKYYAVLNTGSNADGILKIYLDGVQVFDKRDLVYRTDESLIDTAHIAIFAGGSGADWNMTADSYIRLNYFDWQ